MTGKVDAYNTLPNESTDRWRLDAGHHLDDRRTGRGGHVGDERLL